MRYVIPGNPIPLQRPRFSNKHCWDSQKATKMNVQSIIECQHQDRDKYTGPLLLDIIFFMPFPQSRKKRGESIPHIFRPDLSNLIKFIEDVAQGILYQDDCLIAQINAIKYYDDCPRTEFSIMEIKK